ncbi:hypothetical protein ACFX2C_028117 [Malus domestica]
MNSAAALSSVTHPLPPRDPSNSTKTPQRFQISTQLLLSKLIQTELTQQKFYCLIFPEQVAVAHTIGHVAATVSMSKVAVSFTHIINSGEPAFSVLVSRFMLGESFPTSVYLSVLPIIGGCGLAALTELNFNMIGNHFVLVPEGMEL